MSAVDTPLPPLAWEIACASSSLSRSPQPARPASLGKSAMGQLGVTSHNNLRTLDIRHNAAFNLGSLAGKISRRSNISSNNLQISARLFDLALGFELGRVVAAACPTSLEAPELVRRRRPQPDQGRARARRCGLHRLSRAGGGCPPGNRASRLPAGPRCSRSPPLLERIQADLDARLSAARCRCARSAPHQLEVRHPQQCRRHLTALWPPPAGTRRHKASRHSPSFSPAIHRVVRGERPANQPNVGTIASRAA